MAKKEIKENIEREYVIPLREKCRVAPRYKKTNKAVKTVKEFLVKHMGIYDRDLNKIKIDKYLNEYLWARGIKNPPHKVKVKAVKSGDIVKVELIEYPEKLKFKKMREEKLKEEAKKKVESKKTIMEKAKETMQSKKQDDKNKDGIEDKKEEKIKEETSKEAEEKIEKEIAKKEKHTIKAKKGKEKLAEKKEYDQRSQHK